MDKFSYSIGLGIGQNLSSMGIGNLAVDDFAGFIDVCSSDLYISIANKKHYMDKFSYSIGLGIGQNLSSMGIGDRKSVV